MTFIISTIVVYYIKLLICGNTLIISIRSTIDIYLIIYFLIPWDDKKIIPMWQHTKTYVAKKKTINMGIYLLPIIV